MGFQLWTQADIDFMRTVQNDNMPDRATVQRFTLVKNGEGGYNNTWADVETNIPARLWISSGPSGTSEESRLYGEKELNLTDAFIILAWDADVDDKDRIIWTGTESNISRTFKVVGTNKYDTITTATRCRVEGTRNGE